MVLFLVLIDSASPGLNHCFKESLPLPQAQSPFGQKRAWHCILGAVLLEGCPSHAIGAPWLWEAGLPAFTSVGSCFAFHTTVVGASLQSPLRNWSNRRRFVKIGM